MTRIVAEAAKKTAIMKSGNMSLGVNLLAVMTKKVAQALDEEFDIEILEMHHNKKIDAPSGTALLLGEAAAAGPQDRSRRRAPCAGATATPARARPATSASRRCAAARSRASISVIFAGLDERIELVHKATDRMIFARGALQGGAVGHGQQARALFDARCAWD